VESEGGNWFSESLSWRAQKRNKIYSWDDCCGGEPMLKEYFPRFFVNST